jgi:hypothetical protein
VRNAAVWGGSGFGLAVEERSFTRAVSMAFLLSCAVSTEFAGSIVGNFVGWQY